MLGLRMGAELSRSAPYVKLFERHYTRHPELFSGLVFAENSGWDLSRFKAIVPAAMSGKIEFLSIPTNDFIQERGKSYNEMLLINKVLDTSIILSHGDPVFLKVTGRYGIINILAMLRDIVSARDSIRVCYSVWPRIRTYWNRRQPPMIETRRIAFRKSTWNSVFRDKYKIADNRTHQHFETIMFDVIKQFRSEPGWLEGFRFPPLIIAKQGHPKRIGRFTVPKCIEPMMMCAYFAYHCVAKFFTDEWDLRPIALNAVREKEG